MGTLRLLRAVSVPHFGEHWLRTLVTIFGIALGVAVLVAITLVNQSISRSFEETIDSISGKAELEISAGTGGFDEEVVERVREVPGVSKVAPVVTETALIRAPGAEGERLLLLGVDLLGKDDEFFRTYESEELPGIRENPLGFLNSKSNIILSRKLAKKYGYALHDKIPLATPDGKQDFEIWGFAGEEGAGRSFGGAVGIMYYQSMQAAFGKGVLIDRVDLAVHDRAAVAQVAEAVRAKLGKGFEVEVPKKRNDRVNHMLGSLRSGLDIGSFIALLVGMFLIFNTMSISVVQRRRELGILRALGATRRATLKLITGEALLLGMVGSAVGVAMGIGLASGLLRIMTAVISETFLQVAATELHVDAGAAAKACLAGSASAVISSLLPAWKAMNTSTIEAIKSRGTSPTRRRSDRFSVLDGGAIAGACLAVGLLQIPPIGGVAVGPRAACFALIVAASMISPRVIVAVTRLVRRPIAALLGVEGRMAAENLPRDLHRIAITTSALMIGVAMTTAFGSFLGSFKRSIADWVNQTIPADLFITASAATLGSKNVPITPELEEPLAALPGVEDIEMVRQIDFDLRGAPVKLGSTQADVFMRRAKVSLLEGDPRTAAAAMKEGACLVTENLARRHGVKVGESLSLSTPRGPHDVAVAGILIDYSSDRGMIVLDRAVYLRSWPDARVDTYKLYLAPGTDVEALRRKINGTWGERFNLFVLTNGEVKDSIYSLLDQTFMIMRALELVAVLIAVLGIINALLANVLDRIRELSVLRAVGMRRGRILRMVITEAGLIGLLGNLLGLALGLILGWILLYYINFVQMGWYFPFRPPWPAIAETLLVIMFVSALAGWYPAHAAVRIPVTEGLEYE